MCDNPEVKFDNLMSIDEKIRLAAKYSAANGFYGFQEIICERPVSLIFRRQVINAKEVLTGLNVQIIARNWQDKSRFGRLSKPYYGETFFKYGRLIFWGYIDNVVTCDDLSRYAEKNIGPDGTFSDYKEELEAIMSHSIESYNEIPISEYVYEESINDIYGNIKRTRMRH